MWNARFLWIWYREDNRLRGRSAVNPTYEAGRPQKILPPLGVSILVSVLCAFLLGPVPSEMIVIVMRAPFSSRIVS